MTRPRRTLQDLINEPLRAGFDIKPPSPRRRFKVEPHRSAYQPGIDTGKLNQLVDEPEMEAAGRRLGQPRKWGEATVNGSVPVGLPWVVPSGFIRLMTHPRLLERPLSAPEATRRVRAWLEAPSVTVRQPGRWFAELFLGFLDTVGTAGNLTTEAQLAALAAEHQPELNSNDADFSRFPGLRWHNPLP